MRTILSLITVLIAAGCSTQKVNLRPSGNLKAISSSIDCNVHGDGVDPEVMDALTRNVKAKLIVAGFDIDAHSLNSIELQVDAHSFDPGDVTARLVIGMGAGRGSLLYTARYVDQTGHVLAEMEGQEYFTGGEVNFNLDYGTFTTLGGPDVVRRVLPQEAAKHIAALASAGKT